MTAMETFDLERIQDLYAVTLIHYSKFNMIYVAKTFAFRVFGSLDRASHQNPLTESVGLLLTTPV